MVKPREEGIRNIFEDALDRLIIGLGNPGREYEWTRHNIGAQAVKAYAAKLDLKFHAERGCLAYVAKGEDEKGKIFLVYLMTFMNESGRAGERVVRFLNVDVRDVLVAFDDIETAWNDVRIVSTGGARGHNGIRSLQTHLKTKDFRQLRIGVGHPGGKDVAEYVLDRFSAQEMNEIPSFLESVAEKMHEWVSTHDRESVKLPCQ